MLILQPLVTGLGQYFTVCKRSAKGGLFWSKIGHFRAFSGIAIYHGIWLKSLKKPA